MASSLTSNRVLCNKPLLIRKCTAAMDTDGLAITHGETSSPTIVILGNATTGPTTSEMSYVHTSDTVTTIDCETSVATTEIIMIWVNQSSGGIS